MRVRAVILAAGQGTRMKSSLPKVLHPLLGIPMLQYPIDAVSAVSDEKPLIVVGHGAQDIRARFQGSADFVTQEPQLGTGHAVQQTEPVLSGKADLILVTYGDMPLLTRDTFMRIIEAQKEHSGPITMLSMTWDDPRGFGRVIRDECHLVRAIVEEAQATPEQLAVRELNTGVYCFSADWLWDALHRIPLSKKGEYYLTDTVELAVSEGLSVQALELDDPLEGIGINTRVHLSEVEIILRRKIIQHWMLEGVTIIDPARTYIEPSVQIGQDTTIWPDTYLMQDTVIGSECNLGPGAYIKASRVGDRSKVFASVVERAQIEQEVSVGPYAHLRRGAHLAAGVHVGNFGEVKSSYLGPGTKMGHFSYIGDAQIGPEVNIGAGTITCNFDGEKKNLTEIGPNAFIGSDTMLVAPVNVGEGARTGAGAVVTKDVPPYTLAVGVPARAIKKIEKRE
jgi:bifunctional UDP-N-acetylglucosamine pyrophosphorylase/glucosamine-1-phosphate N-acetyltransferase